MRRVTVPPAERWRWSRAYLGAFPAGPLPRRAFPRVLPFDREPLDDSTFTGLLAGGDSEEPRQRYVRYARARAARPGAALPQIRLGQLYLEVGLIGAAERLLRGCRSDSDLEPTERQAVLRSLAQIAARRRDRDALAGWVAELEAAGWTVESVLDPETAQTWRTLGGAR